MLARDVQLRLRTGSRRGLTSVLRRVPPRFLEPLRRPWSSRPGSMLERARAGALEVARHRGIPEGVRTFSLPDRPDLSFISADSMILQRLYWFGESGYEPGLVAWWRYFCRRSTIILELGANVGYYTVQGATASPNSTYTAVEPHPHAIAVCEANLALNQVGNVSLVKAAAVADPAVRSVTLTVPQRDHFSVPTGSFLPSATEIGGGPTKVALTAVEVPAVAVAQLISDVELLKLDVEGQEHDLLEACGDHLRSRRPTIFVEILGDTPRLRSLVTDLCTRAGYSCYVAQGTALLRVPTQSIATVMLKQDFGTRDVILTVRTDLPTRLTE